MFRTKQFVVAYYLLAMISVRYALRWKGKINVNRRLLSSTTARFSAQEEGHQTSSSGTSSEEQNKYSKILMDHQSKAARLPLAEDVRTLIHTSIGFGVLSTNSQQLAGFPSGSIAGFQLDDEGKPFFVFSSMSSHTKDLLVDGRSSLVVTSKDFKGAAEGRVTILGEIAKVTDSTRIAHLRNLYLKKHQDAYWIDFGDFSYFAMNTIKAIRFVGGFARAGNVTPEEYFAAKPDPISAFAETVMKHMNEDHADSTQAMVQHYVGIPCSDAKIVALDRLGMTILAKLSFADDQPQKIRLPFIRPAEDRKSVKEILVEMTKASAQLK